jgi:hypothetical protein
MHVEPPHPCCAYAYCDKRLGAFAFMSKETYEVFCSEGCFERDQLEREPLHLPVRLQ